MYLVLRYLAQSRKSKSYFTPYFDQRTPSTVLGQKTSVICETIGYRLHTFGHLFPG